jgi:hypothetical protein
MKAFGMVACAALFVLTLLVVGSHKGTFAQTPSATGGDDGPNTVSLNFTSAFLDPAEGNSVVRAFVPTGSKSVNCLATLNEIASNSWPAGVTVYCGEREPSAFGGVPGVLVSVFFNAPAPPSLAVSVTLYQRGARKYGPPVLCTATDGC